MRDAAPRPDQRAAYAEAIGVTLDELAGMLSSVPASVGETPDWLVNYLASEQSASELRAHEPRAVFGLLQASPYVEALVGRVGDDGVSSTYLQRTVEQRLHPAEEGPRRRSRAARHPARAGVASGGRRRRGHGAAARHDG